jgi:hypothetical protein
MLNKEVAVEDVTNDDQMLLLPVWDDKFGIITHIGLKEPFTFTAFKNFFRDEFLHDPALPDSEFAKIVESYLRHGKTQKEAEDKASALCETADSSFAHHAYQFFKRNVRSQVNEAISLLKAQAITHAKIVLNNMDTEDDEGLCAIAFSGADSNSLLRQELSIAASDVRRRHAEAKRARDELLTAQSAAEIEMLLRPFEEIKEYHDEQRQAFFNSIYPRNDQPNDKKWQAKWLEIIRTRFGKTGYRVAGSAAIRPFPEKYLVMFANESAELSNPKRIALEFYGKQVLGMSGERYRKKHYDKVPANQKPKRIRKKPSNLVK